MSGCVRLYHENGGCVLLLCESTDKLKVPSVGCKVGNFVLVHRSPILFSAALASNRAQILCWKKGRIANDVQIERKTSVC